MRPYPKNPNLSIALIPPQVLAKLHPHDIMVLHTIFGCMRTTEARCPEGGLKAYPSEEYIAKFAKVHRCTVSRSIARLKKMKLITAFQIRDTWQKWRPNLYRLGWAMKDFVSYAINQTVAKASSGLLPAAHYQNILSNGALKTACGDNFSDG